jgi:8-oxo-dGTP diphosphatase
MAARKSGFVYEHPRPSVTVDCVIFGVDTGGKLGLLLVQRKGDPFRGMWALPGGFVRVKDDGSQGEDLEAAAHRELKEETSADVAYLEQLCTVGTPGRDPRGRVISVAYMALVRSADHVVTGGSDAADAKWHEVASVIEEKTPLAFDHIEIVRIAIARLQAKVRYAPIGFNLLPSTFTLSDLQRLYETVLQRSLDKRNFRRRILAMGILAEAGQQRDVPHRAAALYRFDARTYDRAVRQGFNFEL